MTCPICHDSSRSISVAGMQAAQHIAASDGANAEINYQDWWREGRRKFTEWQGQPAPCICQPTQPTQVQAAKQLQMEGRAIRIGAEVYHPSVQARIDREQAENLAQYHNTVAKQRAEMAAESIKFSRQEEALARNKEKERRDKAARHIEAEEQRFEEELRRGREEDFNAGRTDEQRYAHDFCERLEQGTADENNVNFAHNSALTHPVDIEPQQTDLEQIRNRTETRYQSGVHRWMDGHNDERRQFLQNVIRTQDRDDRLHDFLDEAFRPFDLPDPGERSLEASRGRIQYLEDAIRNNEHEMHEIMANGLGVRGPHMDNFFGCGEEIQAAARGRLGDLSIRLATSIIVTRGRLPLPVMQTEVLGNSFFAVRDALSSSRCRALLQQIGVNYEPVRVEELDEERSRD